MKDTIYICDICGGVLSCDSLAGGVSRPHWSFKIVSGGYVSEQPTEPLYHALPEPILSTWSYEQDQKHGHFQICSEDCLLKFFRGMVGNPLEEIKVRSKNT